MAKVFLDSNDKSFTVSNNNTTVYGTNGAQAVRIAAGVTGVTFDQNVESVLFEGPMSNYTFAQAGNGVKVFSGSTLIATIPTQGDTDGTRLTFANGTVNAVLSGKTMTVGGTAITATAAPVTPATIDPTVGGGTTFISRSLQMHLPSPKGTEASKTLPLP